MAATAEASTAKGSASSDPDQIDRAFAETLVGHRRFQPGALPSKHDVEALVEEGPGASLPEARGGCGCNRGPDPRAADSPAR